MLVFFGATQLDSILVAGEAALNAKTTPFEKYFQSKHGTEPLFTFGGIVITPTTGDGYRLGQPTYASNLKQLSNDATFEEIRSLRNQVPWLNHTNPDVVSIAGIGSPVTAQDCARYHVRMLSMWMARAHATPIIGLHRHLLAMSSVQIDVYADATLPTMQTTVHNLDICFFSRMTR